MSKKLPLALLAVLFVAALASGIAYAAEPSEGPPQMVDVDGSIYYTGGMPAENCTPITVELRSSSGELKYSRELCTGQYFPPYDEYRNAYMLTLNGIPGEDTVTVKALGISNSSTAKPSMFIDITGSRPGIVSDIGRTINSAIGSVIDLLVPNKPEVNQTQQPASVNKTIQPVPKKTQPTIPDDTMGTLFIVIMLAIAAALIVFQKKRKKREKKVAVTGRIAVMILLVFVIAGSMWFMNGSSYGGQAAQLGSAAPPASSGGQQIVVRGNLPTGYATNNEEGGGAQTMGGVNLDVNTPDYGHVYGPNGENVMNSSAANWTFIADDTYKCGDHCDPSTGICLLINVLLVRNNASNTVVQNRSLCGGQGYYSGEGFDEDIFTYYNSFSTVLTTENGRSQSDYTVKVTANNYTRSGVNTTPGLDQVYIDVSLTHLNDFAPPTWSGNMSYTPAVYSGATNSAFNITWTDEAAGSGMGTVWLESNFSNVAANYSMSNSTYGGSTYSYSNVLPAGTFYWKSYGIDANGNQNVSDTWYFTIGTAANPVDLTINDGTAHVDQGVTITYGTSTTVTGSATAGAVLTKNDSSVSNPESTTLSAGSYRYKVNATGNQNYSANATGLTFNVIVNQATNPLTLTLNGQQNDITITYGASVTPSATGPDGITVTRNDTAVTNLAAEYLAVGHYAFKANSSGNGNYLTNSTGITYYVTINKAATLTRLFLNGTESNRTYAVNDLANFTVALNVSGKIVYLNTSIAGWALNYTTTPLFNYTVLDTAGVYNITGYFAGDENYTASSQTYYATVTADKAPLWSVNMTSIPNNYSTTNSSKFNITWADLETGVSTVLIEGNWSGSAHNYTPASFFGGNISNYSEILPAGIFYWRSYANDTVGHQNVSDIFYFRIYNASNIVDLMLNNGTAYTNRNIAITHGTQTTATSVSTGGSATLYRNESAATNPEIKTLAAGVHAYKANATGNGNYTDNATGVTYYVTAAQEVTTCSISTSPSGSTTFGTPTTVSCSCTNLEKTAYLYRNDTNASSENGVSLTLPGGQWNYTCNVTSSQNYTANTTSSAYTVSAASMTLQLLLNGTNGDRTYRNSSTANFTITTSPSAQSVILFTNYSNGVNKQWDSGTSPFTNLTRFATDAGVYNFTARFAGNQNYSAASSTHYATVVLKDITGITLYFNGGSGTSFETGTSLNITAALNVSGKTIYLYSNFTNYTQSGTTPITNVTTYGTDGTYNITAWFPGDADNEAANTTVILTMSTTPPAPPSGGGGGGGGGGGAAAAPEGKPTYSVENAKYSYGKDDIAELDFSVINPLSKIIDVTASTVITKDGQEFWKHDDGVRVNPNSTYTWNDQVAKVDCSTPYGAYAVNVKWMRNGTIEKTDDLTYLVSYACKAARIRTDSDKASYNQGESANLSTTTENTGNVPLTDAVIEETLTGPNTSQKFSRTVTLGVGKTDYYSREISTDGLPGGVYTYEAEISSGDELLDSSPVTFMIVVTQVIEYAAVGLASLSILLVLATKGRGPWLLKKTIILLPRRTKVDFRLVNRTKHCYKNVIVTDNVPAKIAMAGVRPKPTLKRTEKDGSIYMEWHIKHVLPKEKKQFHYTLGKKKRFLPHARVKKYARDREMEEKLAGKGMMKAERGLFGAFKGKKPKHVSDELSPEVRHLTEERNELQERLNEVNRKLRVLGGHVKRHAAGHARRFHGHVKRHAARLARHVRRHITHRAAHKRKRR